MPVVNPLQKVQCPFCSADFRLRDCNIVSKVNPANVLHNAQDGGFMLPFMVKSIFGPQNTRNLASRQCPNPQCRKLLPRNIEIVDQNITIAVIGDTFSGKSHHIAVTIDQLRRGYIPKEYGYCMLSPAEEEIEDTYQREYYQPLFQSKKKLPNTVQTFDPNADPLIYELILEGPPRKHINLLIYDVSGEGLVSQVNLVSYRPHLLNAKAILFLADPWAMKGFTTKLAHHLQPDVANVTGRVPANVLYSMINVFKSSTGQVGRASFSVPVAIALSKADLIPYLRVDPYYHGLYSPAYADQMDIENDSQIDQAIRSLLQEVNEGSLLQLANTLEKSRFFVTSATGNPADEHDEYQSIEPYRCLDPLFWILKELHVID